MYKDFDEYIVEFLSDDFSSDFWYDVAAIKASKMLEAFTQNDWDILFQELTNKPIEWRRKVAYCIEDSENGLKVLLTIINTEDDELFHNCIDSIRTLVTPNNRSLILKNEKLMGQINTLKNSKSDVIKKVYQDIINKLNS